MRHAPRENAFRDSWAGQLDAERAGTTARVSGWVHRRRDHGHLIFIDLRERSGIVQLVFNPASGPAHAEAHKLRSEDVVTAAGTVNKRAPENVNPNLATGEIEIAVTEMEILADSETPPFPVDEDGPTLGERELGDVVICPEHTQDLVEAVVHGVLHLTGMDHETDDGEMLALQAEIRSWLQ